MRFDLTCAYFLQNPASIWPKFPFFDIKEDVQLELGFAWRTLVSFVLYLFNDLRIEALGDNWGLGFLAWLTFTDFYSTALQQWSRQVRWGLESHVISTLRLEMMTLEWTGSYNISIMSLSWQVHWKFSFWVVLLVSIRTLLPTPVLFIAFSIGI